MVIFFNWLLDVGSLQFFAEINRSGRLQLPFSQNMSGLYMATGGVGVALAGVG